MLDLSLLSQGCWGADSSRDLKFTRCQMSYILRSPRISSAAAASCLGIRVLGPGSIEGTRWALALSQT